MSCEIYSLLSALQMVRLTCMRLPLVLTLLVAQLRRSTWTEASGDHRWRNYRQPSDRLDSERELEVMLRQTKPLMSILRRRESEVGQPISRNGGYGGGYGGGGCCGNNFDILGLLSLLSSALLYLLFFSYIATTTSANNGNNGNNGNGNGGGRRKRYSPETVSDLTVNNWIGNPPIQYSGKITKGN